MNKECLNLIVDEINENLRKYDLELIDREYVCKKLLKRNTIKRC